MQSQGMWHPGDDTAGLLFCVRKDGDIMLLLPIKTFINVI
jgi:hypothetical protein